MTLVITCILWLAAFAVVGLMPFGFMSFSGMSL
jgi:Na+-transporting NADH:ubiquinone oxidoreductase subunit NqrE